MATGHESDPLQDNEPGVDRAAVPDQPEDDKKEPKKQDLNKLCGMSYKALGLIFAGLWATIVLLQMVTLGVRTWVEQGSGKRGWKGSLTFCTDCLDGWQDEDTWEAISKKACRTDEEWWLCDVAENLMDAAESFLICELLSLVLSFFCFVRAVQLAYRKECDCAIGRFPRVTVDLAYFWVLLVACFLQLLGTGLWFEYSEAKSDGSCDSSPDNLGSEEDVCITDGPRLAIAVSVLITIVTLANLAVLMLHQLRRYRNWTEANSK